MLEGMAVKHSVHTEEPQTPTNIFRLVRIARNVRVKDLAEHLRVTPAYINAIEKGTSTPSCRLVRDYAEALNVDESIFYRYGEEFDNCTRFEEMMLKLLKVICA